MRFFACHLAIVLWIRDEFGSWFDLCNHETVLELSELPRMHGWGHSSSCRAKYTPIIEPIYSFVFIVNEHCSSMVNWYLQSVLEVRLYPLILVSLESVIGTGVSCLNMMLLMDIPSLALLRNLIHNTRSFCTSSGICTYSFFSARAAIRWVRFMKYLADGRTLQTCFSRPMRVASSLNSE